MPLLQLVVPLLGWVFGASIQLGVAISLFEQDLSGWVSVCSEGPGTFLGSTSYFKGQQDLKI